MQLPNNEVGISDILQYRDCAQRFAWGMQRHVPLPERFQLYPGEKADAPGSESYATAYGHMVHDAIEVAEKTDCSDQEAIDAAWPAYQHWLEPGDLDRIRADLQTWRERRYPGWRLVGTEVELKMPLFQVDGKWIYFRARIDAIYQSIENPGLFMTRDWKSSRWAKTEAEVHGDLQQWSYNLVFHYNYPECTDLEQLYDQLRHGPPIPTRKNAQQRREIRDWLIQQVKAILGDDILKPTINDWCQYCPLLADCRETHRAADFWINRLAALAPEKKEGRKLVVQLTEEHTGFEIYTEQLPKAKKAHKQLERFIEAVEDVMRDMPEERLAEHGYKFTKPRGRDTFTPQALKQVVDLIGLETFLHLVSITKKSVEDMYGDNEIAEAILALAERAEGKPSLKALSNAA